MTILASSPIESSCVTLGKKVVMNKFRSVSEVSHSPTSYHMLRMPHSENPQNTVEPLGCNAPHFLPSESHP